MHIYTTLYAMLRPRRNETDKNVTYSFGLLVITVTETFRVTLSQRLSVNSVAIVYATNDQMLLIPTDK